MGEEHENGAGLHDGFDENEDVSEDELVQIEDDGVVYNCAVLAIAESEGQEYAMLAPADQLSDAEEEGELLLFIVQYTVTEDDEEIFSSIEDDATYERVREFFSTLIESENDIN